MPENQTAVNIGLFCGYSLAKYAIIKETSWMNGWKMLKIERGSGVPIYQQIYKQIKADILSGNLPDSFRITSTRMLAKELRVGRNSVESAYEKLVLEGYIAAIPGSGYTVNRMEFDLYQESPWKERLTVEPAKRACDLPMIQYSFQYGELESESFPSESPANKSQEGNEKTLQKPEGEDIRK